MELQGLQKEFWDGIMKGINDVYSNSKGLDDITEFSDINSHHSLNNDENLFDLDNHDSLEIDVRKSRDDSDSDAIENETAADKVEATDNDSLKAWRNCPTLLAKHYCFHLKSGVTFLSIANDS